LTVALEDPEIKTFKTFETNVDKYTAKRHYYMKKYPESYVAVLNGEVIAHNKNLKQLLEKVAKEHDTRQVLIDYLTEKVKLLM
jgi:hypothetical protein